MRPFFNLHHPLEQSHAHRRHAYSLLASFLFIYCSLFGPRQILRERPRLRGYDAYEPNVTHDSPQVDVASRLDGQLARLFINVNSAEVDNNLRPQFTPSGKID